MQASVVRKVDKSQFNGYLLCSKRFYIKIAMEPWDEVLQLKEQIVLRIKKGNV